jgi:hypothetical protein
MCKLRSTLCKSSAYFINSGLKPKLHKLPGVNLPIIIIIFKFTATQSTILTPRNRPWSLKLEMGEL